MWSHYIGHNAIIFVIHGYADTGYQHYYHIYIACTEVSTCTWSNGKFTQDWKTITIILQRDIASRHIIIPLLSHDTGLSDRTFVSVSQKEYSWYYSRNFKVLVKVIIALIKQGLTLVRFPRDFDCTNVIWLVSSFK